MESSDDEARGREHLGEALDSMALLLLRNIQALAAPPAYSPFARATAGMRRYGCRQHCEHDDE